MVPPKRSKWSVSRLVKRNNLESSSSSEQIPESSVQKARRGRPKKARVDPVLMETSQNETTSAANVGIPQHIDEVVFALEFIGKNKRSSTELAYRMPLAVWKHVTIGADVRTQVSLQSINLADGPGLSSTLTENAPMNKSGKAKKLQVHIGIEAVNQYKKAWMALHEIQVITRGVTWPSPKVTKEVKNIIKQYGMVYYQVQTNADRAAHCMIRDSYKIGQLVKMLLDLWCSTDKLHLRERFSIAARHHMLLRDQDLRNLNFSDFFYNIVPRTQHRGVQQAIALIFCLDKGKTLKDGECICFLHA
ncbi:hypothetical protein [Parasitella parasitica]|uniref:Ndc10 domain-containing protein n=1 Tax=Parasitella parasitica TaxID=35722 RepID=A0A0B7NFW0_9FUNG|nr:hypothetical protein [Parasitella parasitica]